MGFQQTKGPSGDAKVLLQDAGRKKKKNINGYNSGRYKEGWIEFEDKRIAKSVAKVLNLQEIAQKKGGAWAGQFWTLKYLSKFHWDNLHEQLEHERQLRKKKIREDHRAAKEEQSIYLKSIAEAKKSRSIAKRRGTDTGTETKKTEMKIKQRKLAADYIPESNKTSN